MWAWLLQRMMRPQPAPNINIKLDLSAVKDLFGPKDPTENDDPMPVRVSNIPVPRPG